MSVLHKNRTAARAVARTAADSARIARVLARNRVAARDIQRTSGIPSRTTAKQQPGTWYGAHQFLAVTVRDVDRSGGSSRRSAPPAAPRSASAR